MITPLDVSTLGETPKAADGGRRKRSPVYDVFELRKVSEEPSGLIPATEAWFPIATEVRAGTDREAVTAATADFDEDRRYGTFWAPLSSNVRPRTRAAETVTKDVWS